MPILDPIKRKQWHRNWIARRKAEWFAGKSCNKCGSTENLELEWALGGKSKRQHRIWSWSDEKRASILKQYRPVCRDCRANLMQNKLTPEQVAKIRVALLSGYGRKAAARLLGHCQRTIEGYLAKMDLPDTKCACGGEARHQGTCWWRLTLDELRLDETTREELRQWKKARVFLNKTKAILKTTTNLSHPKSQDEELEQAPTSQTSCAR